jgi:hypothetical protein
MGCFQSPKSIRGLDALSLSLLPGSINGAFSCDASRSMEALGCGDRPVEEDR